MQPVTVEVGISRGTASVVISGELDVEVMPALWAHLAQILDRKPRRLVFDLAGVRFMDCAAARQIVSAGQYLPGGRRPVIRYPSPGVRRILELTGLDALCDMEG